MSLAVSNLAASIDGQSILHDVSFVCDDVLAIIGPSGSGKTTLLRAIAGLQKSDGRVTLGGEALKGPVHTRNIGYVEQINTLFPHMTIEQNVAYPLKVRGVTRADRSEQAQELLDQFGVGHLASRMPQQASGGEQQRIGIARALIAGPQLLLLDEPFRGLDAILRADMLEWLTELIREQQIPTLFVTHDIRDAQKIAQRGAILDHGQIVGSGQWNDLHDNTHPTVTRLLQLS